MSRPIWISAALSGLTVVVAMVPDAHCQDWNEYADRQHEWYVSAEGVEIAENIMSWQSVEGSWPKNGDTVTEPYTGDREDLKGIYDNGATFDETRFLARAYNVTGDTRYKESVLRAIDDMLDAQYPTGGWPQRNPPGDGYPRHITFNDDTMVNIMYLMKDVATSDLFAFIDADRRTAAAAAFDAGIECILNAQIVVDHALTAWCAQHDAVTLEPQSARSYEHESISGSESVDIVLLLMEYGDASDRRVVNAVNSACEWFETVKLTGIRVRDIDDDKRVVADPDAPPIWARFYEIGTNRPIFSGRDGVIKYALAEIERERRRGYGWYGDGPEDVLEKWPEWRKKVQRKRR